MTETVQLLFSGIDEILGNSNISYGVTLYEP